MKGSYLRDRDRTFLGQLLFGLFAGIRVTEMGVEIFIQDLCGLFVEVSSFPPVQTERVTDRSDVDRTCMVLLCCIIQLSFARCH